MKLKRELGLFSVCSIACGAMLSGVFVLPGHAYVITGPAVYLGFLLAGILFVPAALSKAEMATALPESGGDYVFIDRALGPVVSTITGLGTWLALVLKSAFALVGLSAYLLLFVPVSNAYALYIAAGIGLALIVLNCLGVKKAGQVQTVLVVAALGVLMLYVDRGSAAAQPDYYKPFATEGFLGFLQATAFVFVSYAGVTKVASAAEEVKNPGRNIPLGIIISLTVMTLIYTLVTHVHVGVVPAGNHGKYAPTLYRNAPLAQSAFAIAGAMGEYLISIIAVAALASMANAGLLASSRYPLAMARYDQLPEQFASINSTFSTPVLSVAVTGGIMIFGILFLPVVQLAKLASGFLLFVFGILNFAVVIFRESDIEWYNPEFRAPLYPYLQFTGLLVSLTLLVFLGPVPFLSAMGLALVGVGWYYIYVRDRVDREATLSRSSTPVIEFKELTASESALMEERYPDPIVLVPFFNLSHDQVLAAQARIEIAVDLFKSSHRKMVLNVHETSDTSFLPSIRQPDATDRALKRYVTRLDRQGGTHLDFNRTVTTHSHQFLHRFVGDKAVDWTLLNWRSTSNWGFLVSNASSWMENFPGDILLVKEGEAAATSSVRSVVNPFPGSDQSFVVDTAQNISPEKARTTEVDFYFEGSPDDAFGDREERLAEYFQNLSGRSIRTNQLVGYRDLEDRLVGSDPEELFVLDRKTAGYLETAFPEQHSGTLARPVQGSGDSVGSSNYRKKLSNLLSTDDLYLKTWKPLSKRALFHQVAKRLSDSDHPVNVIEKSLWTTEKAYETYTTNGIAIPHAIVPEGPVTGALMTLDRSVSYLESGEEIDMCLPIVGGEANSNELFSYVAAADALANQDSFVERIKTAEDPSDILKLLRSQSHGTAFL